MNPFQAMIGGTYRPSGNPLAKFTNKLNGVGVGNSLTFGVNVPSRAYPVQIVERLAAANATGTNFYNLGHSGYTSGQLSTLAPSEGQPKFVAGKQNVAIIWEIGNTIYFAGSVATAMNEFKNLCTTYQSYGFQVVACVPPDRGLDPALTTTPAGDSEAVFRTKSAAAAAQLRAEYIGYASFLIDFLQNPNLQNSNNSAYFDADHVHFNAAGLTTVTDTIMQSLVAFPFA